MGQLRYRLDANVLLNYDADLNDDNTVATSDDRAGAKKQQRLSSRSRLVILGCATLAVLPHMIRHRKNYYVRFLSSFDTSNASTAGGGGIFRHTNQASTNINCRRPRSHAAMRTCFPDRLRHNNDDDDDDPRCRNITTWSQLQYCTRKPSPPHQQQPQPNVVQHYEIHIIGERHSGTKFLTRVLQQCFPKTTTTTTVPNRIRVHRDLLRSKHFFQPLTDDLGLLRTTSSNHNNNNNSHANDTTVQQQQRHHHHHHHIVVVVVREVVSWMAAMVDKPYHAPHHVQRLTATEIVPLPWREFVQRPWTLLPTEHDGTEEEDSMATSFTSSSLSLGPCQEGFARDEVIPCNNTSAAAAVVAQLPPSRQRGFEPVYELVPPHGRPYAHLLDLRADKIANFALHVPFLLLAQNSSSSSNNSAMIVRYEDLLRDGAGPLVEELAVRMSQPQSSSFPCTPPGPQLDRLQQQQQHRRPLEGDTAFRQWIAQHVHIDMEELMGYNVGWVEEARRLLKTSSS